MSLLMVRKYAPEHAADAYIDDITYKYKVGDKIKTPDGVGTVQKKTHTNSGTPAYEVKLDKGGIVVHVEQSVSAAKDAQDANGDEVIAQKNGCKLVHNTLNDGYWFYTKSGAGWGITATNKVAAVNEFNRLVDSAKDAAAQDRGNYATNTIALLKMAIGNIRTACSVVSRAISNIEDAIDKVKDERAKSSLKSMQQEWWACEREVWAALEKVERIPVPSGVGVPNKAKLSPEDRKFIAEFFE